MTLLVERAGARTDLVAAAHSLRLLLVAVLLLVAPIYKWFEAPAAAKP